MTYLIVFGKPFFSIASIVVDGSREKVFIKFGEDQVDLNFSKFSDQTDSKEHSQQYEIKMIN